MGLIRFLGRGARIVCCGGRHTCVEFFHLACGGFSSFLFLARFFFRLGTRSAGYLMDGK